jgi:hypothetical protein
MSLSELCIRRPVMTTLLMMSFVVFGMFGYINLPVSALPRVDFPTISVSAGLPGASPETMASSVATPLERQFGRIAGVTEMTSSSSLGSTNVTLQFDLDRNIDAAARDVQAAINAARGQLPANLPNNPWYRKVNPADAPITLLALTSDVVGRPKMYDIAASILQQKLAQRADGPHFDALDHRRLGRVGSRHDGASDSPRPRPQQLGEHAGEYRLEAQPQRHVGGLRARGLIELSERSLKIVNLEGLRNLVQ